MNREKRFDPEPSVAVVILSFNNYGDTSECLKSLAKTEYANFTTIVVDNASTDGSAVLLQKEFPHVVLVLNDKNLGFTGGNNAGLQKAQEIESKYVFFLNNDTVVSRNIFALGLFLETNPEIGLVGPLTFYYDQPDIISFAGGSLDRNTGRITFLGKGDRLNQLPEVIHCNFIEGAALFLKTDLMIQLGGFNDDYFLTSEESELCIRIADKGYKLAVLTTCKLWHKVSRSMGASSELINYFVYRNRLRVIQHNAKQFTLRDLFIIITDYIRTLVSLLIKERNLSAAYGLSCGVLDFVRGIKGVGRYRRRLQQ